MLAVLLIYIFQLQSGYIVHMRTNYFYVILNAHAYDQIINMYLL